MKKNYEYKYEIRNMSPSLHEHVSSLVKEHVPSPAAGLDNCSFALFKKSDEDLALLKRFAVLKSQFLCL